ncbi:MAG TPA: hypothetical protein ENK83_00955, partial [Aliiroseovarius sp.]|nr:hypothetical protein [Aliiroseovarius sp.]
PDKLRPPELTTCGAVELLELVGQPVKEVAPPVLENARVIRPGQAVTMDFSPTRLNLDLATQDRIARVWCG